MEKNSNKTGLKKSRVQAEKNKHSIVRVGRTSSIKEKGVDISSQKIMVRQRRDSCVY